MEIEDYSDYQNIEKPKKKKLTTPTNGKRYQNAVADFGNGH